MLISWQYRGNIVIYFDFTSKMSSVSSKSSSSSSLESLNEDFSLNHGLQHYVHEPTVSGPKKQIHYCNIESSTSDSSDEVETRIGNAEWCTCGSCQKWKLPPKAFVFAKCSKSMMSGFKVFIL